MTTFLLARHAASELMDDVYVGRALDPPLTREGEQQARALAAHLRAERIDVIESSPRLRARQTAEQVLAGRDMALGIETDIDEIDVGAWGGERFDQLAHDSSWEAWNAARHLHRPPGGEAMLDVQRRIVARLGELRRRHADQVVLLVTHAEVIRSALLYFLNAPVFAHACIEVSPAAIARLALDDRRCTVLAMNERARGIATSRSLDHD
jgi:broad specificity phosphatase PhoE